MKFIVNSLYCEGSTEAHFYPLTAAKMNESYTDDKGSIRLRIVDIEEALGSEASIIEPRVIGDYQQYLQDQKKSPIKQLLTNSV